MIISNKLIQSFEKILGFVGLGIIAWMIFKLGPTRISSNLHAVSWGFFLIVLMRGARYFFQTIAWKLILGVEDRKIKFWKLFKVNLQGESLNYITITRMGGEPLKALAIADQTTLGQSAASVIVLKFSVMLGFWLTITGSFLMVLFQTDVTGEIKTQIGIAIVGLTLFLILVSWIQKRGMFRPVSWVLTQFQLKWDWVSHQVVRLTRLDNHILETYRSRPGRVVLASVLGALAWIEEIFFIWLTLKFLRMNETWIISILIGTLAMLMNSLFFFVPWRAGTQEGTTVLAFTLLHLQEASGLSLAILRRLRELVWVFAGLILFALESVPSSPSLPQPSKPTSL